jgi:hypothetical protein
LCRGLRNHDGRIFARLTVFQVSLRNIAALAGPSFVAMKIGEIFVTLGQLSARDLERALKRQEQHGGKIGENLVAMGLVTPMQLTSALRLQREVETALPACERTLAKLESGFGPMHPNTAHARCNLARLLVLAGRPAEALPHGRAALAARHAHHGPRHAATAEAEKVVNQALEALRR